MIYVSMWLLVCNRNIFNRKYCINKENLGKNTALDKPHSNCLFILRLLCLRVLHVVCLEFVLKVLNCAQILVKNLKMMMN